VDDWRTLDAVFREFEIIGERLKKPHPELLRICVRSIATGFEALAFALRRMALKAAASKGVSLTPRERDVMAEIVEGIFPAGPPPRRIQLGARETLNVACIVYGRARQSKPPLDMSPIGEPCVPKSFLEMQRIYDRLANPEELEHLDVTKMDVKALQQVLKWADDLRRWVNTERRAELSEAQESMHISFEEARRKILGS
jgi:hypothetical protein